jgi:hypothetical protein
MTPHGRPRIGRRTPRRLRSAAPRGALLAALLAALWLGAVGHGEHLAAIPIAYEGYYGRYLLAPEGALEAALPLGGVVEVIRDGSELQALRPEGPPTRFVPAGRHRFVAPGTGDVLTFDVADGRVRSAYLTGDRAAALVPVRAWQASLLRVGHRLTGTWTELVEMGRMLAPF